MANLKNIYKNNFTCNIVILIALNEKSYLLKLKMKK